MLFLMKASASDSDFLSTAKLKEISFEGDEYAESSAMEVEQSEELFERSSDLDSLIRAKLKIINGDLKLAKFYLNRIDDKKSRLSLIKKRYVALVSFIEGKFDQSIEELNDKAFITNSFYPEVCLLKLINYMATNNTEGLKREKDQCMYYTMKTTKNDAFWLDTMLKLKLKDLPGLKNNLITNIDNLFYDDEMSRLWLKSGLYLNKEKELLDLLSLLPESSYQSKRLREIIAFCYLRSNKPGDKQRALAFVDDIDSANAENIKGNINLQNKEYELAFGHFRLALLKKQDSTNSLERAIPLAWMLGQWKDGLNMLDNTTNKGVDPRNKRALKVAFLIRDKNFSEAEKELTLLKIDFQNDPPFEINVMDSYVTLVMGEKDKKFDKRKAEEITEKACRSFDGISCWLALQYIQWDNLGKTIKRDEETFQDKEMTLDSLKEKPIINPLKEKITVDQRDIEELDGSGIQILKK